MNRKSFTITTITLGLLVILIFVISQIIVSSMNEQVLGPYTGTIISIHYTCSNLIPYVNLTCMRDGRVDVVRLDNGTMIQALDSCYGEDVGGASPPTHANFTYYVKNKVWVQSSVWCL